jgi:hypothetical protein
MTTDREVLEVSLEALEYPRRREHPRLECLGGASLTKTFKSTLPHATYTTCAMLRWKR